MNDAAGASRPLAVVVGATGDFGRAIVARLIAEGLEVVAVARHADALAELARVHAPFLVPCEADISNDDSVATIRKAVTRPVRMVVHGPGVIVAGGILNAPIAAILDSVNIKVGGMLRLVRAVDDRLTRGSRLVAIGGHYGLEPTAYAATAGVANSSLLNVMRQLSLAYGPRGITAHTLAPGPADTNRLRSVANERARQTGSSVDAVLDDMRANSSIGQFTTAQQVAWAVSMRLAPEADVMTGSTLMLDAGRRSGLP